MSDQLEDGYKLLAKDPEMSRPNRKSFGHHCGFDFVENQQTATCNCGSVATNPFWIVKGEHK